MSKLKGDEVSNALRALFASGTAGGASDAELLERFADGHGQTGSEAAFSALLDRHGPMVLAVCRRLAGGREAAEDAFQATFLALIRRAGSIRVSDSLAPWLFAVARRIALRARAKAERPGGLEDPDRLPEPQGETPLEAAQRAEATRLILEEIGRLPEKYRAAVVLCHIERRTEAQAAEALGWPVGTLSGRLSRARRLLQERLERRGLALSVGIGLAALRNEAAAAVPPSLEAVTLRLMIGSASKTLAAGAVPAAILFLEQGATTTMINTIKLFSLGAFAVGTVTAGAVLATRGPIAGEDPTSNTPAVNIAQQGADSKNQPARQAKREETVRQLETNASVNEYPSPATRLNQQVRLVDGPELTLDQILRALEEQTGLPIVIHQAALRDVSRNLDRKGWLRSGVIGNAHLAMTNTLRPLDLDFELDDDTIVIRPKHIADNKKLEQLEAENERLQAEIDALRRQAGDDPGQGVKTDEPGATPVAGGAQLLADEPPDPPEAHVEAAPLEDMTADVTRLFVEKAIAVMELEAAWKAWQRLETFEAEADLEEGPERTEIQQFLRLSRARIRERLEDLAGSPDQAEAALEDLKTGLKRLAQLHAALTGDDGQSSLTLSQAMFVRLRPRADSNGYTQVDMTTTTRIQNLFKALEMPTPRFLVGGMGGGGFQ